jgi:predicted O-methyltransferase YrrM
MVGKKNMLKKMQEYKTQKLIRAFLRNRKRISPVKAHNVECSMIFSVEDDIARPSDYLISISIQAINEARKIKFDDIVNRLKKDESALLNIWPGEHYKLLAGFVTILKPKLVVEIGTERGMSTLCMKKYLPQDSKFITFDIRPWKSFKDTYFNETDFSDGKLIQYMDDLSNPSVVSKHKNELKEADIILIDAAKDGIMEQKFLDNFKLVPFTGKPLLIFDDIRFWNMLKIWHDIPLPKLDLTSFGHWSGTGICEFLPEILK